REIVGIAGPDELALELAVAALQVIAKAELAHQRIQVGRLEVHLQRGERLAAGAPPAPRRMQRRVARRDVELVDAPVVAVGLGLEVEGPQPAVLELEALRGDVE